MKKCGKTKITQTQDSCLMDCYEVNLLWISLIYIKQLRWMKIPEISGGILTNPYISPLLNVLGYSTWYQSNTMTSWFYQMVDYEQNLIWIFMSFSENIRNDWKM